MADGLKEDADVAEKLGKAVEGMRLRKAWRKAGVPNVSVSAMPRT